MIGGFHLQQGGPAALRQLLSKWRLILDQQEKANLPEAVWPDQQADHFRQDLEATRQSILANSAN